MKTLTITRVFRKQKTSSRTGKEFTSLGIQCKEYPGKWINGFGGEDNAHWKEGDKVEVEIEQKGDFLDFKMPKSPKGKPLDDDRLTRMEQKLDKILELLNVQPLNPPVKESDEPPVSEPEDSVPF